MEILHLETTSSRSPNIETTLLTYLLLPFLRQRHPPSPGNKRPQKPSITLRWRSASTTRLAYISFLTFNSHPSHQSPAHTSFPKGKTTQLFLIRKPNPAASPRHRCKLPPPPSHPNPSPYATQREQCDHSPHTCGGPHPSIPLQNATLI